MGRAKKAGWLKPGSIKDALMMSDVARFRQRKTVLISGQEQDTYGQCVGID
jgi:hypothetical protein